MGDTSIKLWINGHQYDTLERILTERGTNIETVMQARLIDLYRQTVPEQERVDINNQIESERLAAEQREAELHRFSVSSRKRAPLSVSNVTTPSISCRRQTKPGVICGRRWTLSPAPLQITFCVTGR